MNKTDKELSLMGQKYQIQFQGELQQGTSQEQVVKSLAFAYKKSIAEIEEWFSGKTIILRAEATEEEVKEFEAFFTSLGMKLVISPITEEYEDETVATWKEIPDAKTPQAKTDGSISGEVLESHLESSIDKLKEAIKNNQHAFIFRPASLLRRFLAFFLDLFIIAVIFEVLVGQILVPMGIIDFSFLEHFTVSELGIKEAEGLGYQQQLALIFQQIGELSDSQIMTLQSNLMGVLYFSPLVFIGYFAVLEGVWQWSLGKYLCRLKVYSLRTPKMTVIQSLSRTILFFIGLQFIALFPPFGLIVFLCSIFMANFDKNGLGQTFYDRLSKTCVGYR